MSRFEAVIGLEVHAQLSTRSKMFCGCSASYGGDANTQVCPVCLGLPGALPVVNRRAVEYAVRVGHATCCSIARQSVFARKNYFYPDCPKDYQISQYDTPLCTDGYLEIGRGRRIGIKRIHLEEDAGKLLHAEGDHSYVDMNRSGVPLVEIVSEPDLRTPAEASEYLQKLRSILRYLDVCDGNMEEGSLRCDVNVSIRESGAASLSTKTEIKNVNSFKFIEQAIEFEIARQGDLVSSGREVTHDTLLWDSARGTAKIMRTKEEAHDYRYFAEPDLPPLRLDDEWIAGVAHSLPELPDRRRERFVADYGLPDYDAGVLTASREIADYFEEVARATGEAKAASNWVMGEVMRELNERRIEMAGFAVGPLALAELIAIHRSGRINTPTAKEVFRVMAEDGGDPEAIIASGGLEKITDAGVVETAARRVIDDNPDALAKYLAGKQKLLKFFVGQVMKATGGKVDPRQAEEVLMRLLEERR